MALAKAPYQHLASLIRNEIRTALDCRMRSAEDQPTDRESVMPPEIKRDSLSTSYYGEDIYVEAWQPEGGEAFVHVIVAGDLPELESPDCGNHPTLDEAMQAGLRLATSLIDN
ncbi:hypothetical protein VDF74_06510 [Xanthomonas campestris pv. raphani]|uniref:hypothetical protein n=1 Tax=Xanthomonas campestris TaxID=339 RepID=UPI002B22C1FD|nr:hypothetical protein [Xanthomonas campestris]MEA9738642.1 hypothetical protein [Xanthomonas campestris pv. raphani]